MHEQQVGELERTLTLVTIQHTSSDESVGAGGVVDADENKSTCLLFRIN